MSSQRKEIETDKKSLLEIVSAQAREANKHIQVATSYLIHHLPEIGIDVEMRWQDILKKYPDRAEDLQQEAKHGGYAGGEQGYKDYVVYCELVEEKHPLCSRIQKATWVTDNGLHDLASNTYANPFIALEAKEPKHAIDFCNSVHYYFTGESTSATAGFQENAERAIIDFSIKLLRKFHNDLVTQLPSGTPDIIEKELQTAVTHVAQAMDAMEKVRLLPANKSNAPKRLGA